MQVRENPEMDQNDRTTFTARKTYTVSRFTVIFLAAILLCSIIAAGLLIYNFATCPEIMVQSQVCDKKHVIPLTQGIGGNNSKSTSLPDIDYSVQPISGEADTIGLRLPTTIVPISYDIKLIPFLFEGNFTFNGDIRILINVTETCQNITLHAVALKILENDVSVWKLDQTVVGSESTAMNDTEEITTEPNAKVDGLVQQQIGRQYFIERKQFYIIEFNDTLHVNALYEVRIKYSGVLNDVLQGFYRSSYNVGNVTRWMATTQFQPTDARRALPCFDEPALKAKFKLTLARPWNMTSLSNMPQMGKPKPVDDLPGYFWDEYMESVPMSTYLLAFIVTDFKNITHERFSVWARADAIQSARYALNVGPKILKYFEEYFNISYPLPKMDMISLPDFSAGAMENWGLITFREVAMLYEPKVSSRLNMQRVATIVSHELAHQFFGNLVTPSWWSDLWLNEGFASYMEYVGVEEIEPSWKIMDQFVCNEVQSVFGMDALSSSHKISIEVQNPEEINEIFDRISYGKGASIIRMMDHFLTTKVFRAGLSSFLKEKAYQAATQNDLWEHLTQYARSSHTFDNLTSVKEIMDTWTLQTGFPVVTVNRNYETKEVEFKQSRFVYIGNAKKQKILDKLTDETLWWIPLTYTTSSNMNFNDTKPSEWIRKTSTLTKQFDNITEKDWLLVNIQQTGYYRVNYDENNWKLLGDYLEDPKSFAKIAATNRAQLVDDALNLARGGILDYQIAMNITRYLSHENDYVPWKSALSALSFIDGMMVTRGSYNKLKQYLISLIEHVYEDVGFDDHADKETLSIYKRVDILSFACRLGHQGCVQGSITEYKKWMNQTNPDTLNQISPNLRSIVYCTAIKYGDQKEWDFAWERFQKASVSSEKEILLEAMACSRETWILSRYLERSLTDAYGIRKHDVLRVFASVSSNVIGMPITFNFVRSHWHEIKDYLGPPMSNLYGIFRYTFRRINNRFDLEELKRFTHQHVKDTSRTMHQVIENAETNIEWMEKNYKTIVDWLDSITPTS